MTSSLRNSIHRRNHKERSQLAHRKKLGLLEKHSDYVKRARDYHSKQNRLNLLKRKAAERNKDEFYFSMTRERTNAGVHLKDRGNVALPTDIVKVLKTQDENYVRTMRASGLKKIDKIKNHLMEMTDLLKPDIENSDHDDQLKILEMANLTTPRAAKRKHLVFAMSSEEASRLSNKGKEKETKDAIPEDTEADLGWKTVDRKKKVKASSTPSLKEDGQNHLEHRTKLLKELSARIERDRQLRYAQREFEMQRLLMGKGARRKMIGVENAEKEQEEDEDEIDARRGKRRAPSVRPVDEANYRPRVYKWRLERKR